MLFARYNCGCVGIPLSDKKAVVIKSCDSEVNRISFYIRNMEGKTFEFIYHPEDTEDIVHEIDWYLQRGQDLEDIVNILTNVGGKKKWILKNM